MKSTVIELARAKDQRQTIQERVGDLKGHQVLKDLVLVATYIEPEITAGGILKPDSMLDESRYQGKVGLVLKLGPTAFEYDGQFKYVGPKPKVGDWVKYHPSNAREFFLGGPGGKGNSGISCRHISSELIEAIIEDPTKIW
jgi:co-chaperonin GroES (HSP10)